MATCTKFTLFFYYKMCNYIVSNLYNPLNHDENPLRLREIRAKVYNKFITYFFLFNLIIIGISFGICAKIWSRSSEGGAGRSINLGAVITSNLLRVHILPKKGDEIHVTLVKMMKNI